MNEMKLICEVKKVEAKKKYLDKIYTLTLETTDSAVMALGVLDANQLIKVVVTTDD